MEFNPYSNINQCKFFSYEKVFNDNICQTLEHHSKTFPCRNDNGISNPNTNNSFRKVSDIKHFPEHLYPFELLLNNLILEVNHNFKFDIKTIKCHYAEYIKGTSYLKWHNDIGSYPMNLRKISFSINVNDYSEYEGGDLEFNTGDIAAAPQNKGNIVFFPSFLLHRITPITKGVRKVLLGFIEGPPFK